MVHAVCILYLVHMVISYRWTDMQFMWEIVFLFWVLVAIFFRPILFMNFVNIGLPSVWGCALVWLCQCKQPLIMSHRTKCVGRSLLQLLTAASDLSSGVVSVCMPAIKCFEYLVLNVLIKTTLWGRFPSSFDEELNLNTVLWCIAGQGISSHEGIAANSEAHFSGNQSCNYLRWRLR